MKNLLVFLFSLLIPGLSLASTASAQTSQHLQMTHSFYGIAALLIFAIAYALVMVEEFTHLRKSKPVVLAAGIIWILIAICAGQSGNTELMNTNLEHNLLEYAELFLFLLVAMTYVNAMEERLVFETLRCWLVSRGFSYRQ